MTTTDYSAQIEALESALASNELTVESDGDRVTYKSTADLRQALAYFRQKQAGLEPRRAGGFGFSAPGYCRD